MNSMSSVKVISFSSYLLWTLNLLITYKVSETLVASSFSFDSFNDENTSLKISIDFLLTSINVVLIIVLNKLPFDECALLGLMLSSLSPFSTLLSGTNSDDPIYSNKK